MLFVPRSFDGVLALALIALACCAARADEPGPRWKLTLYKATGCRPCEEAHRDACDPKNVFGQFADSVDLVVKNVSEDEAAAKELKAANPRRSTPTFVLSPPPGSKAPPLVLIGYGGPFSTVAKFTTHRAKHPIEPVTATDTSEPTPTPAPPPPPIEKPAPVPEPPKIDAAAIGGKIAERVRDDVKKELESTLPPIFVKIGERIRADIKAEVAARTPEIQRAAGMVIAAVCASAFFGGVIGARIAAR